MTEFELIKQFFSSQTKHRDDVVVGIGDDAAIVNLPPGQSLAITTDSLVADIHFPQDATPYDIGYKALAVNLSDLAAMGAMPAWVTMALTMPEAITEWIQEFCDGFFTLANRHQVQLIGGDLTHGPLSITVQAMGFVPPGQAILRSQAKPGDLIYVTGNLGDAGLALACWQNKAKLDAAYQRAIMSRLHRPEPRVATGMELRTIATAAIDISDGFAADLGHILEESQVGAMIYIDHLPLSNEMLHSTSRQKAILLALTAGDDYELCFTVPKEKRAQLEKQLSHIACRYTCVGEITAQLGLDLRFEDGNQFNGTLQGYEHF